MYIIFDSNIWISELGLNSAKGAAARLFIKTKKAKVVVPEVVRLETERNLRNQLSSHIADIGKNYRQLLPVFGKLKEIVLPDENAINEKVDSIFQRSQLDLIEIPLSLESAISSFLKTIDKIPPSDKDQQFKDGVIWADCIRLLAEDDVFLVTTDKAFYEDRKYERGIAMSLANEIARYDKEFRIFPTVSDLIQEIKTEVKLDEVKLVEEFVKSNHESIYGMLSRNSFAFIGEPRVKTDIYATEDPNRLYVEFEIMYRCEDLTSIDRTNAKLILKGDGSYSLRDNQYSTLRNYGEELLFKTPEGEEKSMRNVVLFADSLVIGHKTVEHSIKYKLD